MAEISIVVPVYQVQPFLHRCIDSIRNQSFEGYEAALVDDGSPDDCGDICDEYSLLDSRLITIHQVNGGLSCARNTGIDAFMYTSSHWITFIDSDDWVHRTYLELLYSSNIQNQTNISMCQFVCVSEYGADHPIESDNFKTIKSADALLFRDKGLSAYAWGILYTKSAFFKARFPDGMLMEDFYIIPEIILNRSEKVSAVGNNLYYYFQHPGSILHNITYKCFYDAWMGYDKQISLLRDKHEDGLLALQVNTYIKNIFCCLQSILNKHLDKHDSKTKRYVKRKLKTAIKNNKKVLDLHDDTITRAIKEVSLLLYVSLKFNNFKHNDENNKQNLATTIGSLVRAAYYKFLFPKIKSTYRKHHYNKQRKKLKNDNFSIICSNCVGGFIYHNLGKQFLSPTLNCWMNQLDFIRFAKNLKYYLSLNLNFIESEYPYPVAMLDDVCVHFNHTDNAGDAERDWEKRKKRVNYDNIYVILYDNKEGITEEDIRKLPEIDCKNLAVFSYTDYPNLDYVYTMPKPQEDGLSELYFDQDKFGIRTFEKHFDYVKWLNSTWNKT